MVDISHQYRIMRANHVTGISKEHWRSWSLIKSNKEIVILHPDKGHGVVVMDKNDYLCKMKVLLSDETKFKVDRKGKDRTQIIEKEIVKQLRSLLKGKHIDSETFNSLKPIGTHIPKMYGRVKIDKEDNPLRPVLSMVNSPYHKLAQWLCRMLDPMKKQFSRHNITDSFQFAQKISQLNAEGKHFVSFDAISLFTNVPVRETIEFICDVTDECPIPKHCLRKLLYMCTKDVQFVFNNELYFQIDGVAMGSPLGPLFADVFGEFGI